MTFAAQPAIKLSRWMPLLIAAILLGSMILGAATISRLSYWYDEIISIDAINDYNAMIERFPEQMPAYFMVLRGWISLVGEGEVAGRWLSLLLGLITLSVTYRLAHRYTSPAGALWSLIILGTSAFFVRYYREMRPYSFLVCFGTISMWFFLEWLHTRKYHVAVFWLLASITALYAHYFAGLLIAAQGLYFLYHDFVFRDSENRPRLKLTLTRYSAISLGVLILIALALVPYLQSYLKGLSIVAERGRVFQALSTEQAISGFVQTLTNDNLGLFLLLAALAVLARWRGIGMVLLWLILPLGTALFVHIFLVHMLANPRYLIFIWPAMAMLGGLGIATIRQWSTRAAVLCAVIVIILGIGQVIDDLPGKLPGVIPAQPWREMASVIGRNGSEGNVLIVNMVNPIGTSGYREPLLYYLSRYIPFAMPAPLELDLLYAPDRATIIQHLQNAQTAWFMITDGQANKRGIEAIALLRENNYTQCRTWEYQHETELSEWQRVNGDVFTFGKALKLQKKPLNRIDQPLKPGATIDLAFGLYVSEPIPIDYSFGVYLFDANGAFITQNDSPPANSRTSTWTPGDRYCHISRLTLPQQPGTYIVRGTIYDSQTGTRLEVDQDVDATNTVPILTLEVK
jgi:hypothetical protein